MTESQRRNLFLMGTIAVLGMIAAAIAMKIAMGRIPGMENLTRLQDIIQSHKILGLEKVGLQFSKQNSKSALDQGILIIATMDDGQYNNEDQRKALCAKLAELAFSEYSEPLNFVEVEPRKEFWEGWTLKTQKGDRIIFQKEIKNNNIKSRPKTHPITGKPIEEDPAKKDSGSKNDANQK